MRLAAVLLLVGVCVAAAQDGPADVDQMTRNYRESFGDADLEAEGVGAGQAEVQHASKTVHMDSEPVAHPHVAAKQASHAALRFAAVKAKVATAMTSRAGSGSGLGSRSGAGPANSTNGSNGSNGSNSGKKGKPLSGNVKTRVKAAADVGGYDATTCPTLFTKFRTMVSELVKVPLADVAISGCKNSEADADADDAGKAKRRRLLGSDSMVTIEYSMQLPDVAAAKAAATKMNEADPVKLVAKLKALGADAVTSCSIQVEPVQEDKPPSGGAFGLTYTWPVIGDEEIDKQAEKVAEWLVRSTYRVEQEKNATAAVIGTRALVIKHATQAQSTTAEALEARNEPGEEVSRHIEASLEDTQKAKEFRRQLKVLKDYRKSVTIKRKAATTTRDAAIGELLRLKVLRVATAKALWKTLKAKTADLRKLLQDRLLIAMKDAEAAKVAEVKREPKPVVLAKLDASEKAQEAARHVKEYLSMVQYKQKCAKKLLSEWQCKVQINCTVAEPEPVEQKPLWSTPTLDALADHMNEAIATYKDAKEQIPPVPMAPKPKPKSAVEKRIEGLEKKYMTGDFAPGMQIGACKMEGGAVGHFVKGDCVAYETQAPSAGDAEMMKALEEGGGSGDASGARSSGKPAGDKMDDAAAGQVQAEAAGGAPKKISNSLAAIEARIKQLEKDTKL